MKKIILILFYFYSFGAFSEDLVDDPLVNTQKSNLLMVQELQKNIFDEENFLNNFKKIKSIWRSSADATSANFSFQTPSDFGNDERFSNDLELLLEAGKTRSDYITKIQEQDSFALFDFSLELFEDLKRELKLVPMKWYAIVYLKVAYINGLIREGLNGVKTLVYDVCILIIIFLIPFFFWRVTNRSLLTLKKLRSKLVRQSYRGKNNFVYTELLKYLISYLPWTMTLISLIFVEKLVLSSHFPELSIFIPFVRYFIVYKIFKNLILEFLLNISNSKTSDNKLIKSKASKNAALLSRIVLVSVSLLYAIESVVSKGISFYFLEKIFICIFILALIFIGASWKKEISEKIAQLKIPYVSNWLSQALMTKKSLLLSIPSLFILISYNTLYFIFQWCERFDFVKKITAQFFKKKLESSEAFENSDLKSLPESYLNLFEQPVEDNMGLFVKTKGGEFEEVMNLINNWVEDQVEENSLALIGESGSGKTTTLTLIEKNIKNAAVIRASLPSRVMDKRGVLKFIGNLLGLEIENDVSQLVELDGSIEKTILLIDETQNCFLSQVNGFEGFKTILDLINARLENVFILTCFNSYSWNFLLSSFGKNHNFRNVITLAPFTDSDVKNLILKRHDQSDIKLSFYEMMKATRGSIEQGEIEAVEEQFFRLLWEQSLGNPRISLYMWLSSLKVINEKRFSVGLPHDDELSVLSEVTDDALFVFAAIVKHENLSTQDAVRVTSLSENIIRFAMKFGLDNEILKRRKNGHYILNIRYQSAVINYLRKKNLVYAR